MKPGPAHLPPGCHHTARTKATIPSGRGPSPLLAGSLQVSVGVSVSRKPLVLL